MDYKNGQIYTIRSHQTDLFYIGSTCSPLSKRMGEHRGHFRRNDKYITSFEIIKYGDAYIELLEDFPCKNKKELNRQEGKHIRFYIDKCVNKQIAGRTHNEYYIDHKAEIDEYQKEYMKKYMTENKSVKSNYDKEYRAEHKLEITEYQTEYRAEHKAEISQHKNKKYDCECGGKYTHINKNRHIKSLKHKNYLSTLQDGQVQICENE